MTKGSVEKTWKGAMIQLNSNAWLEYSNTEWVARNAQDSIIAFTPEEPGATPAGTQRVQ